MHIMGILVLLATAGEFDTWREERPFWGGVLMILASLIIAWIPLQFSFELLFIGGAYTVIGLLFAVAVFLSGVFALLRPDLSRVVGITGIVFSLLSLIGALGGMFVGLLVGVVGGNLCIAWEPPSGTTSRRTDRETRERSVASGGGSDRGFGGQADATEPTTGTQATGSTDDGMTFAWQDNVTSHQSSSPTQSSGSTVSSGPTGSGKPDTTSAGPAVGAEEEREPAVGAEGEREPAVGVEEEREPAVGAEGEREPAVGAEEEREPAVGAEEEREPAVGAENVTWADEGSVTETHDRTGAEAHGETDAETGAEAHGETDAETGAEAHGETGAETGAEAHGETGADTDADTEVEDEDEAEADEGSALDFSWEEEESDT